MSITTATIIRSRTADPFARIPKALLDDTTLGWKAKGLLCYLLGKPENWTPQVNDIAKHGTDGEDSIRAGLVELRKAGYAELQKHVTNGRVTRYFLQITDAPTFKSRGEIHIVNKAADSKAKGPELALPHPGKPDRDFPHLENPDISKKDRKENDVNKNEKTCADAPVPLPPDAKPNPKTKHTEFMRLWCEAFEETYGDKYPVTPQDGKALKEYLASVPDAEPAELAGLAKLAWTNKKNRRFFKCGQSGSINTFLKWSNDIRAELRDAGQTISTGTEPDKWADIGKSKFAAAVQADLATKP